MTNVLLEKKGHIAVATINRPKALNALNSQVLEDIDQLVEQVKADDEIRALVITGSGEKAFVAGADIGEMSTLTKAEGEAFGKKGNDVFRAAIAVAPVTSWRFYDTIYTEIYNGLPQDNPSGYDDNSPIHFADRLKGKLLIAHGTGDDNVHIQNTYEMITKLVEYDKPFELYVYPDRNHGMGPSRHHLMERCIEFVQRNL